MAWRVVGGLAGWLGSLAPLVIVNVLAFATAIDPSVVPVAGGVALIAGIALGGLLAGLLGGKRGAGWGGLVAGAIAAVLLAGTLIGLTFALQAHHQLPYLLALHPIRTMEAIGFIACLVIAAAALVGSIAGRSSARRTPARPDLAPDTRGRGQPHGALQPNQRPPSQPNARERSESRARAQRW